MINRFNGESAVGRAVSFFSFFLFLYKPEILFNKEQSYTGRERASALTTETKQEGPNPTSKEPK